MGRIKYVRKNLISGLIYKMITIVMPFCIRTAILYMLGENYLGLSSLFTSILQVLNLAELGFSSAIIYDMYKPIAENDSGKVCSLMNYYRRVYFIIGIIVLVMGILTTPFLPFLVKGDVPLDINIYILYILYVMDSSVSYMLFAYKSALLNAMQRIDLVHKCESIVTFLKYIIQMIVLWLTKNYYFYLLCSIVFTIINNFVINLVSKKYFPDYVAKGSINTEQKLSIKQRISGLIIEKVCDKTRNSFDSIILSSMFGLVTVAIYNNYYYVFSALYSIMLVINQSMQASIGNSIALESTTENYNKLIYIQFIFSWVLCFCCSNMFCLFQPFMKIWAGKELMLDMFSVSLITIYFYALNINNSRNLFFTGKGLWWKAKKSYILETICNVILNIVLGMIFNIDGIILATIITILIFNYIYRSNVLFREYFKISPKSFYLNQFKYFFISTVFILVSYHMCGLCHFDGIIGIIEAFILNTVLTTTGFYLIFRNNKNMKKTISLIKKVVKG